jgi:hypothetical protein
MALTALPDVCYEFDGDGVDAAGLGPTLTGGTYSVGGKLGSALDGGTTAEVFADPVVDISGDCTLAFWFQQPSLHGTCLIEVNNDTGGYLKLYTLCLAGTITQVTFTASNTAIPVGHAISGWAHVAVTRSGTLASVFINGSLVNTATVSATDEGATDLVRFDVTGVGLFDQFIIASRAMSASELLYLYNGGDGIAYDEMEVSAPPSALTLRFVSKTDNGFTVDWDAPADNGSELLRYEVYRSVNGSAFTLFDNIAASATSYSYSTGTRFGIHALALKAVNAGGAATLSNSQGVA